MACIGSRKRTGIGYKSCNIPDDLELEITSSDSDLPGRWEVLGRYRVTRTGLSVHPNLMESDALISLASNHAEYHL